MLNQKLILMSQKKIVAIFPIIFLVWFLLPLSCSNQKQSKQSENNSDTLSLYPFKVNLPGLSQKKIKELETKIQSFYQDNYTDFNGAFLVAKNGQILLEHYQGIANYKEKTKIDSNTPIHLASVSKPLTATAVLKLIADGKLQLQDKVQQYLPNFPYPETTLESLLNHRSGIPNYLKFAERDKKWNSKKVLRNEDVVNYMVQKKLPRVSNHNRTFAYNNSNYVVLALVIEMVTGKTFPQAMKEILFDPLGMEHAFVFDYFTQKEQVSGSYKSNYQMVPWDEYDALYGDKNIYATPRDLWKFHLSFYSDFLPDHLKELQFKGYSYEKKGVKNYGLGFRMNEWDENTKITYHNGWWHGNTTSFVHMHQDTVVMIALSNKYSKKPYQTIKMSAIFGNYPYQLQLKKGETETLNID